MNSIKKIIVLVILIATASFGFISCSDEEESINNGKISQQVNIKNNDIPNSTYIDKIGIKETNKDDTLSIGFVKYTKSKGIKIKGKNIPDGTYHARSYNIKDGKEVDHVYIVKDNYIVQQFEDGKEIEVEASDIE